VRPWDEIRKGYTHFADGDVGLAKITPCFENGKSTVFRNLTGGLGSGTTELHVVRPLFVDPDFILIFLKCPHFIETGIPTMTGTAGQKRFSAVACPPAGGSASGRLAYFVDRLKTGGRLPSRASAM
jgi:type I restriction enzyme S subunit